MKTETEIRLDGMNALMQALGLVEAERFLMAISRERFNYTEWRRTGLPDVSIEELARLANLEAEKTTNYPVKNRLLCMSRSVSMRLIKLAQTTL